MPTKAELEAENTRLREDMALIADRFAEAACANELCGEYDSVVTELNEKILIPFPHREREVDYVIRGVVTVPFERSLSLVLPEGTPSNPDANTVEEAAQEPMRDTVVAWVAEALRDHWSTRNFTLDGIVGEVTEYEEE
jgi:hypothetical protein